MNVYTVMVVALALVALAVVALWNANFDLTYSELSENEQRSFRALSAFAVTGFSSSTAAGLWGKDEAQAIELLEALLNLSLVMPADTPGRFQLHDLLHDYASKKLPGFRRKRRCRSAACRANRSPLRAPLYR